MKTTRMNLGINVDILIAIFLDIAFILYPSHNFTNQQWLSYCGLSLSPVLLSLFFSFLLLFERGSTTTLNNQLQHRLKRCYRQESYLQSNRSLYPMQTIRFFNSSKRSYGIR